MAQLPQEPRTRVTQLCSHNTQGFQSFETTETWSGTAHAPNHLVRARVVANLVGEAKLVLQLVRAELELICTAALHPQLAAATNVTWGRKL